jgi:cobalt/nickel transport system permease protein
MSGAHWRRSYAHLDSPVHRAPAWLKLLATLALVIGVALVPVGHAIWTGPVLIAVLVGARASRVPLRAFVARLAVVQPFVLGVAVLALFQGRGLDACAAVAFKTTTCVTAVQLLAHTTPFPEILRVMERARVPSALVAALSLLHRYLYVLLDESSRMRRARDLRTWRTGRWTRWRSLSSVVAVSFVRSIARAERIAAAMRARGRT